jgi:hypothetical protein
MMIKETHFTVDLMVIDQCRQIIEQSNIHSVKKLSLNVPTGRFFYDPWMLKPEFSGTAIQTLYDSLPMADKGEARVIKLNGGECYVSHSDIDDRYHMNIAGDKCYLVNLDTNVLYPVVTDGIWYDMDAGPRHSAINFGNFPRYQLVVRRLLQNSKATDLVHLVIKPKDGVNLDIARFNFDDTISQILSRANKQGCLANFSSTNAQSVSMDISSEFRQQIITALPEEFVAL